MRPADAVLDWLLDKDNPSVRYITLRDLIGLPKNDPELIQAKKTAYAEGAIRKVLNAMNPDGYWVRPGPGYNPKYRSGVWSLILLSQLGADVHDDERLKKACLYYLDNALTKDNSFSVNGTPSGTVYCLEGNMCAALAALGVADERLDRAYEQMAKFVLGKSKRYYAYTCGPNFACGVNAKKPCSWGAVKVLFSFGKLAESKRTPLIKKAIEKSAEFFFSIDPFTAAYPTRTGSKPSRDWWKFGFPVFYITDLLQLTEALATTGYGRDPRLKNTVDFIRSHKDRDGRWPLEYDYQGKTWGDYGRKKEPSKWITLRALKVLRTIA